MFPCDRESPTFWLHRSDERSFYFKRRVWIGEGVNQTSFSGAKNKQFLIGYSREADGSPVPVWDRIISLLSKKHNFSIWRTRSTPFSAAHSKKRRGIVAKYGYLRLLWTFDSTTRFLTPPSPSTLIRIVILTGGGGNQSSGVWTVSSTYGFLLLV